MFLNCAGFSIHACAKHSHSGNHVLYQIIRQKRGNPAQKGWNPELSARPLCQVSSNFVTAADFLYNTIGTAVFAEGLIRRRARLHNVTFYSDSSVFGGNEQMAIRAHQAIRRFDNRVTISWIVNATNRRLISALEAAGLEYCALDLDPTFRLIRNPFKLLRKTRKVSQVLRSNHAHMVLLVQGWILDGFDGIFAAKLASVAYCSYIPIAHTPAESGDYRWPTLRTAALSLFFRCISRYITIDEQQAIRLRQWKRGARVIVVENFVPRSSECLRTEPASRQICGVLLRGAVLGVIGRISFRQKCQDWLVDSLGNDSFLCDRTLLLVGEGPDTPSLARQIQSCRWRGNIHLLGWTDNPEEIYRVLDLLIIPSRVEGVPLVMIEALARRIPVVGTDRDGMRSWLPREWRFPFGDVPAMKQAITCALGDPPMGYWEAVSQQLDTATDERRFGRQFTDALIACSESSLHTERGL